MADSPRSSRSPLPPPAKSPDSPRSSGTSARRCQKSVFQTHDAALTGLEGLAVLSVHGAEAQEPKPCLRLYDSRLFRAAEYLDKVHLLALIHHNAALDCPRPDRKASDAPPASPDPSSCKERPRRISESCRGEPPSYPSLPLRPPLGRRCSRRRSPLSSAALYHIRNIGLGVRLALPQIEIHIQVRVIAL